MNSHAIKKAKTSLTFLYIKLLLKDIQGMFSLEKKKTRTKTKLSKEIRGILQAFKKPIC